MKTSACYEFDTVEWQAAWCGSTVTLTAYGQHGDTVVELQVQGPDFILLANFLKPFASESARRFLS